MLNRPLVSQTASAASNNHWLDTKGHHQLCILTWHVAPFISTKAVYLKPSQQEETLKVRPLSECNSHSITAFFCHGKCLMIIPAKLRSLRFWLCTFCVCERWAHMLRLVLKSSSFCHNSVSSLCCLVMKCCWVKRWEKVSENLILNDIHLKTQQWVFIDSNYI